MCTHTVNVLDAPSQPRRPQQEQQQQEEQQQHNGSKKKQNYNNNHNNNNIDMSNCFSALRSTIYLCLTLLCLYICTFSSSNSVVQKFLDRPTTTKVSNHNASLDLEIYLAV